MEEQNNLNSTGTFGPVLETRPFSEDEKAVLEYFFTNIDKNIYAAKDTMPSSLWALLEGGYSRSQKSMRMRFLEIFDDMQKDVEKGKIAAEDVITVEQFALQIKQGGSINLSFFLQKAEKFMRKWAVQYGHDSLKDSDVVRFAIENITQWATIPIEEARLGAYQEKSTRYVEFTREHIVVPTDLAQYKEEITAWNNFLLDNYETCRDLTWNYIASQLDESEFKSRGAFERTVNAKTFDVIRYFLPSTMLTSLGVVWPTREAERHISKLLSDPREEVRAIGKLLLEEGKKISPGLLNHVAVNEYQVQRTEAIMKLHQEITLPGHPKTAGRSSDAVQVVAATSDIESRIAAAILFEQSVKGNSYQEYLIYCKEHPEIVSKVLATYLQERGKFDALPMPTEVGAILFQVTMDYGAYRDLKRHRRNLFLAAPMTALAGFEYPEYMDAPELIRVKQLIEESAQKTTELHLKILNTHPELACYIVMFAHKQQILWQMDPRQLAYVTELRTASTGHFSYRTICQEMFRVAQPYLPVLSQYIRVDMSDGKEGRKKQEEKTVEKLQNLGGDVHKLT